MDVEKLENMSEAEEAEFYYQNREQIMSELGDPVPFRHNQKMDIVFSIRMSSKEAQALRKAASDQGIKTGTYIRQAALEAASQNRQIVDLQEVASILEKSAKYQLKEAAKLRRTA